MDLIEASWVVSLNADCPHCGTYVDLLDYHDFWDRHKGEFDLCEHGTNRTESVRLVCPDCLEEFECRFVY
jgi:hypothetical protein